MVRYIYLAAIGLAATPALAGNPLPAPMDPMVETPPPMIEVAPDPVFSWTGGYVGGQLGWADAGAFGGGLDLEGDDAIGGVHAGYRYDFGGVVAGIELSHDISDLTLSGVGPDVDVDSVTRLTGTLGYASGANLFYGVAGVAQADGSAGGPSETLDGEVYGLGMARMLNANTVMGVEILSHDFDAGDLNPGTDAWATTVQGKLSFKF